MTRIKRVTSEGDNDSCKVAAILLASSIVDIAISPFKMLFHDNYTINLHKSQLHNCNKIS